MKSTAPTLAGAMTSSSVAGGMAGGTPLAGAAIKPLPIGPHTGNPSAGTSHRASGAPVNHFQTPFAVPHVVHAASGISAGKPGKLM